VVLNAELTIFSHFQKENEEKKLEKAQQEWISLVTMYRNTSNFLKEEITRRARTIPEREQLGALDRDLSSKGHEVLVWVVGS